MNSNYYIDNLQLNLNSYFYKKKNENILSSNLITQIFRESSKNRTGHYLLNETCIEFNTYKVICSICVFKTKSKPSIIREELPSWEETKLAYLIILDFENYIVVQKKNISKSNKLDSLLENVDYKSITSCLIDENTQYEKFTMDNLNIAPRAVRRKSYEAIDLQNYLSAQIANNYYINNMRILNGEATFSLNNNTSRINKLGLKADLIDYIKWAFDTVNKLSMVINDGINENFISIFAEPVNFKDHYENLSPNSFLLNTSELKRYLEDDEIKSVSYKGKEINLIEHLAKFDQLLDIDFDQSNDKKIYKIVSKSIKDICLKINSKSITLQSQKLNNVMLTFEDDSTESLLKHLNSNQLFIIGFESVEMMYTNKKLFRDSHLLGNIDQFMKIFVSHKELNTCDDEKGKFHANSTSFPNKSIFNFVEESFISHYDFFVCDDMGNEWADHIGLKEDLAKIGFYHSKNGTTKFSASAFQDIVGQALKNLGNIAAQRHLIKYKFKTKWNKKYNENAAENPSNIQRIRKGLGIWTVDKYMETINNPNLTKEVHLVVNFIVKKDLEAKLKQIKINKSLIDQNEEVEKNIKQTKEIIQILWLLSSLVTACKEAGTNVYIHCKE